MKKVQHTKRATREKCNVDIVQVLPGAPRTSKVEGFATVFNGFVAYSCKMLHLRCL